MREVDLRRRGRRRSSLASLAWQSFAPHGYPESVKGEYFEYQVWDSVQGLCSYVRGVISTSAVLTASGVGSAEATASAAALAWLARDGVGLIGSLAFSCAVGAKVDAELKRWRLFADAINDVGLSLEVAAPLVSRTPNDAAFVLLASLAAACKTACGVAAGAAKAAISAHLATSPRTVGDIAAKEAAQETAVTLVGILAGVLVVKAPYPLWIFFALTIAHAYCNWRAVACLRLATLNAARATIAFDAYVRHRRVLAPKDVAEQEPVLLPLASTFARVDLGAQIPRDVAPKVRLFDDDRKFALFVSKAGTRAVLAADATEMDALRALFEAIAATLRDVRNSTAWRHLACTSSDEHLFGACCAALAECGWDLSHPPLDVGPYRYHDGDRRND
ncbi:hypothetical protein CTAYLR_008095 [Chrysophaeum taylorii]|uniref:Uncharacterized protein n=1 Tax=Chrysophaeum taylorii TaxID=2483200 RepID=A0AAD7UK40_9STRA|nr:hypothetical protein CTAYLR_008095 [Chrysophaeum taylorii]